MSDAIRNSSVTPRPQGFGEMFNMQQVNILLHEFQSWDSAGLAPAELREKSAAERFTYFIEGQREEHILVNRVEKDGGYEWITCLDEVAFYVFHHLEQGEVEARDQAGNKPECYEMFGDNDDADRQ